MEANKKVKFDNEEQMGTNEPSPRLAIAVGVVIVAYASLKEFADPQMTVILVVAGLMLISFGIMLIVRSLDDPQSRLAISLIAAQLLGVAVLGVLSMRSEPLYLLGVAGVLSISLVTISSVRDRSGS